MTKRALVQETSAGGVVTGPQGLLLVNVRNLAGQVVWTFPKGHLEKGESAEEAALREVEEETGWRCTLKDPLITVRYRFLRDAGPVSKVVHWFRMDPLKKTGTFDPEEILECRWFSLIEATSLLVYKSDLKILKALGALA